MDDIFSTSITHLQPIHNPNPPKTPPIGITRTYVTQDSLRKGFPNLSISIHVPPLVMPRVNLASLVLLPCVQANPHTLPEDRCPDPGPIQSPVFPPPPVRHGDSGKRWGSVVFQPCRSSSCLFLLFSSLACTHTPGPFRNVLLKLELTTSSCCCHHRRA